MKPILTRSILLAAGILFLAGHPAVVRLAEGREGTPPSTAQDEADLNRIEAESRRRIEAVRSGKEEAAPRPEPRRKAQAPAAADRPALDAAARPAVQGPKRAVLYFSPTLSDKDLSNFRQRMVWEREFLEAQGYQVLEKPSSEQAVLDDIWDGVEAMSFFGHGGTDPATGGKAPTFAGLPASKWRSSMFMDAQSRLAKDRGLSAGEFQRRAEERSGNFGLSLVRNYSCDSFSNPDLARLFVKPGGLYYGASQSLLSGPTMDSMPACLRGAACACLRGVYDLTEYRVPADGEDASGQAQAPPPQARRPVSEEECAARAGHLMAVVKDWMKKTGRQAHYDAGAFFRGIAPDEAAGRVMVARHLALEDGTVKPLRSGREAAFYGKLKEKLASLPAGNKLGMDALLELGLDACSQPGGSANIQETLLTVHNVMRLLARPQQWSGPGMKGDYGHPASDPASPVLEDLRAAASSGGMSMAALFDPGHGPFQPQPGAPNAEWNAGAHYYYWIGALGRTTLGPGAVIGGLWSEMRAKSGQNAGEQGAFELGQFVCGSMFGSEAFRERDGLLSPAKAPEAPPKPAPKFRVYLFRVWPPDSPKDVSHLLYLRIEDTGKPGLFKFPDGSGGWYWRVGEASGPFTDEEGVCAVLRGYGARSVSYNLGWAPHIECPEAGPVKPPAVELPRGPLTREDDTNRGGGDFKDFDLPSPDPELCRSACAKDDRCWAYTYVKPGGQGSKARCWLKNSVQSGRKDACCVSGVRAQP
ncbi:MAG: PAN domain-containing protein [Elusimicrobia bacterium]|nr:PAN domain-containing protein [Elusimicrobiota bacterium]